jgi:serine/threonine protein kinase
MKKINITASNVNESLDKLRALNMPYGGIDVGDYIEKERMNYKKMHELNTSLLHLLKHGILPMNEKGRFHCDIKDSNILVKEEDDGVRTRLIDWGLSTTYNSADNASASKKIPKVLTNRPFQFNVPFSVVLFNDMLDKMYTEFLKKNPDPTFFMVRSFTINYVIIWINKRGPGHIKALNNIFTMFFERGLLNIERQFKEDLIEFDYTFYFIFEYIAYVLFKFTEHGKFDKIKYFSQVFIKNLDIWGFTMTYLPILEYMNNYYEKLSHCELEIIEKIKDMILYVIECSYVPIDIDKLTKKIEEVGELFLKATRKSTVQFENKHSSSTSLFNSKKNKTESKRESKIKLESKTESKTSLSTISKTNTSRHTK